MYFPYKYIQLKKHPNFYFTWKKKQQKRTHTFSNCSVQTLKWQELADQSTITLKNATDKYWDVIPGGAMNMMSESNVHLSPQGPQ